MRGLTPAEEDALRLVEENTTGDLECGACFVDDRRFTIDDAVFLTLHRRGCLRPIACEVVPGQFHCTLTDLGRLALRLAILTRTVEI